MAGTRDHNPKEKYEKENENNENGMPAHRKLIWAASSFPLFYKRKSDVFENH